MEVGAEVVGQTMHSIMQASLDYEKCITYLKGWLSNKSMEQ